MRGNKQLLKCSNHTLTKAAPRICHTPTQFISYKCLLDKGIDEILLEFIYSHVYHAIYANGHAPIGVHLNMSGVTFNAVRKGEGQAFYSRAAVSRLLGDG
jgi:hypothetical protein